MPDNAKSQIVISSLLLQNDSLEDRASGAGPPASSLQGDIDLAEVPGSFGYNEPTFDAHAFELSLIDDRIVSSRDSWIFSLTGTRFKHKELEFEDDLEFKSTHPSNLFIIHSAVTYSADKNRFLPANVRYTTESLHFIFYSVDMLSDYEITPVASFEPKLLDKDKFYTLEQSVGAFHASLTYINYHLSIRSFIRRY